MAKNLDKCVADIHKMLREAGVDEDDIRPLQRTYETLKKDTSLTDEDRLARLHGATEEVRRTHLESEITKVKSKEKLIELYETLDRLPTTEDRQKFLNNFIEQDPYSAVTVQSISKRITGLTRAYVDGDLKEVWDGLASQGLLIRELPLVADFHREMLGINTGNVQAARLVQKTRDTIKPLLEDLKKAGVPVDELPNWSLRSYSPSKIASNRAEAVDFYASILDPKNHPDTRASAEYLINTVLTRDLTESHIKRLSQSRKMHYLSPEDELEAFMRYGEGSYVEGLQNSIRGLVRDKVLSESLGPRPNEVLDKLITRVQTEARQTLPLKKAAPIVRKLDSAKRAARSITGEIHRAADQNMANWGSAFRNWWVTQLLGLVPLAMASQDSLISLFRARRHAGGFGRGTIGMIKGFLETIGDTHAKAFAENIGAWSHAMNMAGNQRYYHQYGPDMGAQMASGKHFSAYSTSETVKNVSQIGATTMTRLSGATWIERKLRSAFALVQMRSLARWLEVDYGSLPSMYRKVLANNAIDKTQWGKLQRNLEVDPRLGTINYDILPRDLKEQVAAFVARETDLAVVYPGHYTRSMLIFGSRAGTLSGEISSAFTQFLSWPLEMFMGPLRSEYRQGYGGLLGFSAAMFTGGLATMQLYALAKGEPAWEWDDPEFLMRGAMRSGLLSPVGELMLQAAMFEHVDVPAGPALTMPARFLGLIGEMTRRQADAAAQQRVGPLVRQLKDVAIPNIWWLEYALTHRAMDAMMWQVDPQYMVNREQRLAETRR